MSLFGGKTPDAPGLIASTAAPAGSPLIKPIPPTENPVWEGSDFVRIERPRRKSVVLIYGDAGTGKSTFAVRYCPSPVALINFDGRADYAVVEAEKQGRRVAVARIMTPRGVNGMSVEAAMKAGKSVVDRVMKNFDIAVAESERGNIRTICFDTGTEFGEMLTLAYRGNATGAPKDYGRSKDLMNRTWWRIFNDVRASGSAHLVVLARARAIWDNNEPTGEYEQRVADVVRDAVDWAGHIRLRRSLPVAQGTGLVPGAGAGAGGGLGLGLATPAKPGRLGAIREIEIQVTKAGNNLALLGEVYTGDEWAEDGPFVHLCAQLTPGSSPDDWR